MGIGALKMGERGGKYREKSRKKTKPPWRPNRKRGGRPDKGEAAYQQKSPGRGEGKNSQLKPS